MGELVCSSELLLHFQEVDRIPSVKEFSGTVPQLAAEYRPTWVNSGELRRTFGVLRSPVNVRGSVGVGELLANSCGVRVSLLKFA